MVHHLRGLATLFIAVFLWATGVLAQQPANRLGDVLLLEELAILLHDEGLGYGEELDRDILGGAGGAHFKTRVSQIYDGEDMVSGVIQAISQGMTPDAIAQTTAFFETELGQRILRLELSARKAMRDPAVDDMAQEAFDEAEQNNDVRLVQIEQFIELNELVERNVASGLSSNYHFLKGMVDGGGDRMGEADIMNDVWAQEDGIRTETRDWVGRFLFLAYGPLSQQDMTQFLTFSETQAGLALNVALFEGFENVYRTIYYEMGMAVAQAMQSSDL